MYIATVLVKQSTLIGWSPRLQLPLFTGMQFWNIPILRSLYAVPDGDQAPGLDSDGYRVSLKHKVADISRSQYEAYSFATKHNLSEAAVEELLGMLSNVCT